MDVRVKSWVPKNWCFWTVVLEKTLESPLDCKEIQPVHSEEDQPWVFFGGNDVEAETPVFWPPHVKSWPIGKDSDAGRDWWQEEKGTTEDEMAGWHHLPNGCEFEWTPGFVDGQGGLVCCNSWGHRVGHDWATELNWTELKAHYVANKIQSFICITIFIDMSPMYYSYLMPNIYELGVRYCLLLDKYASYLVTSINLTMRVFVMTSEFSWENFMSLCPALFYTPRPNLPVTPGVSWLRTFAFLSPIMKRTSFWVSVLKGLLGLHRTVQL